jgi:hypothetical protein
MSSEFDEILKRSATDAPFRARLLNDAPGAIEEAIGVPLSSLQRAITLKFIEKEAGVDAVFVLPDFVDAGGSLSDAELEAVAGGLYSDTGPLHDSCMCTECCVTKS